MSGLEGRTWALLYHHQRFALKLSHNLGEIDKFRISKVKRRQRLYLGSIESLVICRMRYILSCLQCFELQCFQAGVVVEFQSVLPDSAVVLSVQTCPKSHWTRCRRVPTRHGNVLNIIFPSSLVTLLLLSSTPPVNFITTYSDHKYPTPTGNLAIVMALKFWNNPSYDRTTKRTDNKRRMKLFRSYAPDWSVYPLHIMFTIHRSISVQDHYNSSGVRPLVHEIISFVDSSSLGFCSSLSTAFTAFDENFQ